MNGIQFVTNNFYWFGFLGVLLIQAYVIQHFQFDWVAGKLK